MVLYSEKCFRCKKAVEIDQLDRVICTSLKAATQYLEEMEIEKDNPSYKFNCKSFKEV